MNLARKAVVALIAISSAAMPAATVCGASPDLETINIGKPVRIEVFPAEIKLTSARQQAQLVVTGHYADGTLQDLTRVTVFKSSDEKVVAVDNTVVHPMGDGSAQVTAQVGGQKAVASVSVSGQSEPDPVSFNYGTLVALSKQGCNAGACHGSPSGKGGFRMSLRAFDAELDKLTLVREEFGRRTNPLNPDASLLLKKPMMEVPHGGGKKLGKNDAAYDVLRTWIAEGCRLDPADAPKCVRVEVYPPSGRVLKRPAHTQQLSVRAYFSDGTVRDVTPLAVYTSSDEQVASVTKGGMAVGNDRGEIAVVVRYLEFIETTFITFVRDIDGFAWNDPPANNYIDKAVHDKLRQLKFLQSDLCTYDEFVRRFFL